MSKIFLLIFNIILLIIANTNNVHSCSCVSLNKLTFYEQIKEAYSKENIVFTCKIISEREVLIQDTFYINGREFTSIPHYKLCFQAIVIINYKGIKINDIIEIYTGIGNGDCGFNFEINKQYLVYASYDVYSGDRVDNYLSTDKCKRTQLLDENKSKLELEYLEKLAKRIQISNKKKKLN